MSKVSRSMAFVLLAVAWGQGCRACGREVTVEPVLPGLTSGDEAPFRQALAGKGPDYRPRAEHLTPNGSPQFVNRLIFETSPYLLQHAHNPVSWYAWGDAPFERARRDNKLVLLSVGYSTCHWCHVMEHESFEDVEIATLLNERFVAVKVDREERPDVDGVYMTVVQMTSGHGGWPMTVILTPERQPIFAGTYFPARDGDRGARIGFLSLLGQLAERWRQDPTSLAAHAGEVTEELRDASTAAAPGNVPTAEAVLRGAQYLIHAFDPVWGGFGGAPKFPRPCTLELLARHWRRTGDAQALTALTLTLEKMAAGGMHDQVGGGFHRYSVDERWLVPHFEKMLYDQAQLVAAYLDGFQITGRADFAAVVKSTLDYVEREMTHPDGGFFSATDADSPGPNGEAEEGRFFTWTPEEIEAAVGEKRAQVVGALWGGTSEGNYEGRNILYVPKPPTAVAKILGMTPEALEKEVDAARQQLYQARQVRPPPLLDHKIVTAWNGLMVSAFARAGLILGEPRYVQTAERAADFVMGSLRPGGRLKRTFTDGQARQDAYLDDYAFFIAALLDLFEVTGESRRLDEARALQAVLDEEFWDKERGGYFFTGSRHEVLLARDKPDYDGAEPAGNSVAALNLLRMHELCDAEPLRRRAEQIFAAMARPLSSGVALPKMLGALDFYLDRPLQIVIVAPDGKSVAPLRDVVARTFVPNRVMVFASESEAKRSGLPLLAGKSAQAGKPTAYVCRGNVCDAPTTDAQQLAQQLKP